MRDVVLPKAKVTGRNTCLLTPRDRPDVARASGVGLDDRSRRGFHRHTKRRAARLADRGRDWFFYFLVRVNQKQPEMIEVVHALISTAAIVDLDRSTLR